MAAVAQPTSQLMACDIVPGHSADDPLYLPLIRRFVSNCIGAVSYTAVIAKWPPWLPCRIGGLQGFLSHAVASTGEVAEQITAWVDEAVQGTRPLQDLHRADEKAKGRFLPGLRTEWPQSCLVDGKEITWTERVQLVRSLELTQRQAQQLEERLHKAEAEVAL